MIRTSELNRRILIRTWAEVPNESFGLDPVVGEGIGRFAKHEPVHGLVIRAGLQTGEVPTDLFYVRRGAGTRPEEVTAAHVVDYNGYRYRVLDSLDHEGQRQFTRISCKQLGPVNG